MSLVLAELHVPVTSFFPCIVFVGFPIFFIYLMNRAVMGDIGCMTAVLMAFTAIYLLGVIWKIEDKTTHYAALVGILTLFVSLPVLERILEIVSDKSAASEQIKICYEQIRSNPQNAMAAFRLGKILYEKGDKNSGFAVAQEAVRHLPNSAFREEHRLVSLWATKMDANNLTDVRCAACGHYSVPSALICQKCLGSLHLDRSHFRNAAFGKRTQKLMTIWSCLLIAILIIPVLGKLPPPIVVPVILTLVGIAIWAVVSAFVQTVEPV